MVVALEVYCFGIFYNDKIVNVNVYLCDIGITFAHPHPQPYFVAFKCKGMGSAVPGVMRRAFEIVNLAASSAGARVFVVPPVKSRLICLDIVVERYRRVGGVLYLIKMYFRPRV